MSYDLTLLEREIETSPLKRWKESILKKSYEALSNHEDRHINKWLEVLGSLPVIKNPIVNLSTPAISIEAPCTLTPEKLKNIESGLRIFHPWRKGPFKIHGIHIDTEWRSDLKWERLIKYISPLQDKSVLDIGCGNGYYSIKMVAEKANFVVGIDPYLLYFMQYQVIRHFLDQKIPMCHLPIGIDELPQDMDSFDSVFSMGVLYHRKSPIDHLMKIFSLLKIGGELILETLVVDGDEGYCLMPRNRYAKMRNVWFIPSIPTVKLWLKRCGFKEIAIVDVTKTSTNEQRSTEWMTFESLQDFLDPMNENLTVEGYPAPKRAMVIGKRGK